MSATKMGDKVRVHYTGRLEDGAVFDSSQDRAPLEFTAGGGGVIPGLSQAVLGMNPGESKTVEVAAEDAFGPREPALERRVPRSMLPQEVRVGERFSAMIGDSAITVRVTKLGEDFAVVDANHPLAGRTIIFDLELVSVESQ